LFYILYYVALIIMEYLIEDDRIPDKDFDNGYNYHDLDKEDKEYYDRLIYGKIDCNAT